MRSYIELNETDLKKMLADKYEVPTSAITIKSCYENGYQGDPYMTVMATIDIAKRVPQSQLEYLGF